MKGSVDQNKKGIYRELIKNTQRQLEQKKGNNTDRKFGKKMERC